MKIVLVSHGKLALGLLDTLEMIVGHSDNLYAFAAYSEGSEDHYLRELQAIQTKFPHEQLIICTDVLGGSVNNEVWQLLAKSTNITLLTGMNLPMLMTLVTYPKGIDAQAIGEIVTAGRNGVLCINELQPEETEKEEL